MNYVNVHVAVMRSPEVSHAPAAAVGTWMRVTAYCVLMENGGRIQGAGAWNNRMFLQICGCTRKEVIESSPLLEFSGDDLLILYYPSAQEKTCQARAEWAKLGGRPKKADNLKVSGMDNLKVSDPDNLKASSKGKERKGKEGNVSVREREEPLFVSSAARQAEEIVAAYPANGNRYAAVAAVIAAIDSGEDPSMILASVRAHAACRLALPMGERRFTPGLDGYFAEGRWRDNPAEHPWTVAKNGAHQGPVPDSKKLKAAPPIESPPHVTELLDLIRRRNPDFTGQTWDAVPAVLRREVQREWDALNPEPEPVHA